MRSRSIGSNHGTDLFSYGMITGSISMTTTMHRHHQLFPKFTENIWHAAAAAATGNTIVRHHCQLGGRELEVTAKWCGLTYKTWNGSHP
jgi:hypothetical protein